MVNKIVLTKLNRGGHQTTKLMLNKINNIKQGKLMDEWKQFLLKYTINIDKSEFLKTNTLDDTEIEKQNIKNMIKLVQQGNVYKEYNQLKSKGIAPLNEQNIKILKSKFIDGPEHILKKDVTQSHIECTEEILNIIINQLDTTIAAGIDVFLPHMMVEMWNARNYFPDLATNIIKLFNLIINGRLPDTITKTVFACRLIPVIKKKDEFNRKYYFG